MKALTQAVIVAAVAVGAFTLGARNGAIGVVKVAQAQARRNAERRAATFADA